MKTITLKKKHLLLSSNKNILAVFFLLIFSGLLKAGPEEQTITNIIAEQYLGPYYTWHQQLDMKIHGYEDHLKNNPQVKPSQEDQQILKNLKTKDLDITNYLNNNKTIFGLFSLNELFSTTPWINLIDFKHYENDLYITHSNNEKNLEDHLLSQLARYTHLKCGYLRCAKILGMPTKDVIQLKKTQNVSKALLNDQKLYDDIELHLKQIEEQGLESSFLSSWKNDFVQQIYSTAPYPSNAVAIQLLKKIHTIKKNNPDKEILNFIHT